MKHCVIGFLSLLMLGLVNCSTAPYRQVDELPQGLIEYPLDKQYQVDPAWYWRLRPSNVSLNTDGAVIGFRFVGGRTGEATVIGEVNQSGERFYIVRWSDNGYFFIREKDYQFSIQNKEYLVPLNYQDETLYDDPFSVDTIKNPLELLSDQFSNTKDNYYKINSLIRLKRYFESKGLAIRSAIGIRQTGIIQPEEFSRDVIRQVLYNRSYTNEFLVIPFSRPFYKVMLTNADINPMFFEFPSQFSGNQAYENDSGSMINGDVYTAKFIVLKWGSVFYAYPCTQKASSK